MGRRARVSFATTRAATRSALLSGVTSWDIRGASVVLRVIAGEENAREYRLLHGARSAGKPLVRADREISIGSGGYAQQGEFAWRVDLC